MGMELGYCLFLSLSEYEYCFLYLKALSSDMCSVGHMGIVRRKAYLETGMVNSDNSEESLPMTKPLSG